ncbi:unnamed protein product [Lactuca virosa]|uniref:tRNA-5-taurinomethyluridine 2-sulfurtransferase n=1 Tax=Lactuca virosa TaxID=75947 RepID=A0AAU9PY37_9ASTR|nr:unnamed protein product [Lactuca virosa]
MLLAPSNEGDQGRSWPFAAFYQQEVCVGSRVILESWDDAKGFLAMFLTRLAILQKWKINLCLLGKEEKLDKFELPAKIKLLPEQNVENAGDGDEFEAQNAKNADDGDELFEPSIIGVWCKNDMKMTLHARNLKYRGESEDFQNFWSECPWEEDLKYAKAVCNQVDVALEVVHLTDEYWDKVVSYLIDEYKCGRTPNPDVLCNTRIKFGAFMDALSNMGFEFVASGHYAKVIHPLTDETNELSFLQLSKDMVKICSTYFHYQLPDT